MNKFKEIRPVVLGIAKRGNKILVSEGYDEVTGEVFYRSVGGGIEFLETSKDALKREYKEEINVDVNVGEFLGISENIFVYNGKNAHELILFYTVEINDENYKEEYHTIDTNCETHAMWIDIDKFVNGDLRIYPNEIYKYLK